MFDRYLYERNGEFAGFTEPRYARAFADLFVFLRPLMEPDETGGVLIVELDKREYVSFVGEFTKYPPLSCYRIAQEKLKRTRIMRRRQGHRSAWQSRNPERKKYAGCYLLAENLLLSFSGLSEEWDEALLLLTAWVCELLEPGDLDSYRDINHNPRISQGMAEILNVRVVP